MKNLYETVDGILRRRELTIQESLEYIALAMAKIADCFEDDYENKKTDVVKAFTDLIQAGGDLDEDFYK